MRRPLPPLALCALLGLSGAGHAQELPASPPAAQEEASFPLAQAAIRLEPLRFEGHPEVLSDAQRAGLEQAVAQGFPDALARRYPQARVAGPDDAGALSLSPVIVVPASLSPFESATFRLDLRSPQGQTVQAESRFNLLSLWLAQAAALPLVWDGTLAALPGE